MSLEKTLETAKLNIEKINAAIEILNNKDNVDEKTMDSLFETRDKYVEAYQKLSNPDSDLKDIIQYNEFKEIQRINENISDELESGFISEKDYKGELETLEIRYNLLTKTISKEKLLDFEKRLEAEEEIINSNILDSVEQDIITHEALKEYNNKGFTLTEIYEDMDFEKVEEKPMTPYFESEKIKTEDKDFTSEQNISLTERILRDKKEATRNANIVNEDNDNLSEETPAQQREISTTFKISEEYVFTDDEVNAFKRIIEKKHSFDKELASIENDDTESFNRINRSYYDNYYKEFKSRDEQHFNAVLEKMFIMHENGEVIKSKSESLKQHSEDANRHDLNVSSDEEGILTEEDIYMLYSKDSIKRIDTEYMSRRILLNDKSVIDESLNNIQFGFSRKTVDPLTAASRVISMAKQKEWETITLNSTNPAVLTVAYEMAVKEGLSIQPQNREQEAIFKAIHSNKRLDQYAPFKTIDGKTEQQDESLEAANHDVQKRRKYSM